MAPSRLGSRLRGAFPLILLALFLLNLLPFVLFLLLSLLELGAALLGAGAFDGELARVDLGAGNNELTLLAQRAFQVLTLHVVGQNKPPGNSMETISYYDRFSFLKTDKLPELQENLGLTKSKDSDHMVKELRRVKLIILAPNVKPVQTDETG
jgi:hypothetical protein